MITRDKVRICWIYIMAVMLGGIMVLSQAMPLAAHPIIVTLDGVLNQNTDDSPEFTPDGNTVFFDRSTGSNKFIMISHRVHGRWTRAQVAPFSGHWFDQNPVVSPDGAFLLFDSNRPVVDGGKPLVQDFFGKPGPGSNLWRVRRRGEVWSKPVWLGPIINDSMFIDFPSIAGDGSVYFLRWDRGAVHIFRSQYRDGKYLPAKRVMLGDPAVTTHDPAIAPDESFMVFDYGRVKNGLGRLCIAFHKDGYWSTPLDLGDEVNQDIPWGSRLSPGHHTLYFTGATHIWSVSLTPWLKAGTDGLAEHSESH
jgi:hypothetical protein